MAATVETTALLLDRVLYGESDLILHLLTSDHGIVAALARGARGSKRRFAGALDLFVVSSVRFRPAGAGSTLALLTEAEPARAFPGLYDHLERLEAGQAVLAMARDLLQDAPAGEVQFNRMVDALAWLEVLPAQRVHLGVFALAIGLLGDLGHHPALEPCPACGRAIGAFGSVAMSPEGMLLCGPCLPSTAAGFPSSMLSLDPGCTGTSIGRPEVLALVTALVSSVLGRRWRLRLEL